MTLHTDLVGPPDRRRTTVVTGTSAVVNYPVGGGAGDLVVVNAFSSGATTYIPTPSAGWTQLYAVDITNPSFGGSQKVGCWWAYRTATPLTLTSAGSQTLICHAVSVPAKDLNVSADGAANTADITFDDGGWDTARTYLFVEAGWTNPAPIAMAVDPALLPLIVNVASVSGFRMFGFNSADGVVDPVRFYATDLTSLSVRAWARFDFVWPRGWRVGSIGFN